MPSDYICPVCSKSMPRDVDVVYPHTEDHIADEIKKKHPEWAEANGICRKCYDYYESQMKF